jgi:hypothetical protein
MAIRLVSIKNCIRVINARTICAALGGSSYFSTLIGLSCFEKECEK